MTSHDALAAIGMISLLRFVWVALTGSLARAHAASTLVGNIYWRSDTILTRVHPHAWLGREAAKFHRRCAAIFPPSAGDRSVITQRLPRGWAPMSRAIDVPVGAS